MNRKIIAWCLVFLWMIFIFWLSSMNADESNQKSKKTIDEITQKTTNITSKVGVTKKHPSKEKTEKIVEVLNLPFRKVMHASVYFILSILVLYAFMQNKIPDKKVYIITIFLCFLYACSDEFHQTFVDGRTGQFIDVFIDSIGSVIGCLFYKCIQILYYKKNLKKVVKI